MNHANELSNSNTGKCICVVTPYLPTVSETFITAQVEGLPAKTVLVHGWRPKVGNKVVLSWPRLLLHKSRRVLFGADLEEETTEAYVKVIRDYQAAAVLAHYGDTGVRVLPACRRTRVPLIVHFLGYDASVRSVLEENRETYPAMFREAAAVIAVSPAMREKLISLGAPSAKVHYNRFGIDCDKFGGADPLRSAPVFLAVGRFVEKKAPQLTLTAFQIVLQNHPAARLRMIGDGPLLEQCKKLAEQLGIAHAVNFLGPQGHAVVQEEMRHARCFVQHSVEAPSGDSEGTPVSILEAAGSGLPVVSTRHAGIPQAVVEAQTGFLVDEGDVSGMAACMLRLAEDPELAARLGKAARDHVLNSFSKERSLAGLWTIINSCIEGRRIDAPT
jgi:colanic acid/amylovoran biosynthesis glycosyltransferase